MEAMRATGGDAARQRSQRDGLQAKSDSGSQVSARVRIMGQHWRHRNDHNVTTRGQPSLCGADHAQRRRPCALRRPSAGSVDTVPHRNVGTLLVLRDQAAPRAVHVGGPRRRRLRIRARRGLGHRGDLCRERVPRVAARRVGCRSPAGPPSRDSLRRDLDLLGSHRHWTLGLCDGADPVLHRTAAHRVRNGPAEAEHLSDCRRPVSRWRRAARCRLLNLLYGNQHRAPSPDS